MRIKTAVKYSVLLINLAFYHHAIACGDIIIGDHLSLQREDMEPKLTAPAAPASRPLGQRNKRAAPSTNLALWPSGIVYYSISAAKPTTEKTIKEAMNDITKKTGIQFQKHVNQPGYINIVGRPTCGGWSSIGYTGGQQKLSIGEDGSCEKNIKGRVLHELLHTLGVQHEHQRPDRDSYIVIVSNDNTELDQIYEIISSIDTASPYDFDSIMHHATTDTHTITAHHPDNQARLVWDKTALSEGDIAGLRKLYSSIIPSAPSVVVINPPNPPLADSSTQSPPNPKIKVLTGSLLPTLSHNFTQLRSNAPLDNNAQCLEALDDSYSWFWSRNGGRTVGIRRCSSLTSEQLWQYQSDGTIKNKHNSYKEQCLGKGTFTDSPEKRNNTSAQWDFSTPSFNERGYALLQPCDANNSQQKWVMDKSSGLIKNKANPNLSLMHGNGTVVVEFGAMDPNNPHAKNYKWTWQ